MSYDDPNKKHCTGDGRCGLTNCPHYFCTGEGTCYSTSCKHTPSAPGDWRTKMVLERALTGVCRERGCYRYRVPGEFACSDHVKQTHIQERDDCWYRWCVMPTGGNKFCFYHASEGYKVLDEERAAGKLS